MGELEASVGTLVEIRDDNEASPAQRIRAAVSIINAMRDLRTLRDIEARLTRLEEAFYGHAKR